MNITSVQFINCLGQPDNSAIKAIIDGTEISVPLDPANRHYAEIMRQVNAGTLTIEDADQMPYIGKSPQNGVRNRFVYQATAGQTSFSGSDVDSKVLTYQDSVYMDVYQNGVLLKPGTDYTATTGTTVVLVTGASLNDVVEMVAYDVFSVANSYTVTESDTRYPFKGNNSIIRLNGQSITADVTIDADENGVSAGPITQDNATVTVNGYWSIV